MTNFEDFQKAGKENMDAAVKAMGLVTKSAQTLATEGTEYARKSYEASAAHMEKLFGVKTLDKAIELNTEYVKTSYEAAVAQATKVSNMYTDLVKELAKPMEAAFAKVKPVAAK